MPTFEWPVPKPIQFGTPLSAEQLCATASVEGKFEYHPASGVVLPVGMHALSATFSPADSANYSAAQATLSLPVEKAMPSIEWPMLAPIIFGTPLSTAQLCATVSVPGTCDYLPAPGAVLGAGSHTLSVTFTPTDSSSYATARATVSFDVTKAKAAIDWPTPETIKSGTRLSERQLCANSSIAGTFEYSPAAGEELPPGEHMLSVVFTPADSANFAAVEATVLLTVQAKATPVIAWQNPDPITYGTPLSGQQLCASASVPGRFDYSIEPEVKLAAGTHTLAATFTPADTENYAIANATASLEVIKATPIIDWSTPQPMMEGTPLSATQLRATASTPGSFDYSPAPGAQLSQGTHTLTVTFTPADPANYTSAQTSVPLTVMAKEVPVIAWPAPNPIRHGTPLSSAQFCASASVPGTFDYSPGTGAILAAGTHRLSVRFTPTDPANYSTAEFSVPLIVEREPAVVAWAIPDAIIYGARLSATQLCATASVPGRFDYSPAGGVLLAAGTQKLAVTFTPTDSENYAAAQSTVLLEVAKATPVVEWPEPRPIQFETALTAKELCATTSVPGTLNYSPQPGAVLPLGMHTLSVIFTPADCANYVTTQISVPLNVIVKPSPMIAWSNPDPIPYGTPLSSRQLCATASVPGTFDYAPEPGETLAAGIHILSVTFTPFDTANYATTRASVSLAVEKAVPSIDWRTPEPMKPGTALSDAQLDAMAWIPGSFVYSPPAGEVLPPGRHKLSVTFIPSCGANYAPAQAAVTINVVAKATPVIAWPNPDPILPGTPLSSTQLCAKASVPGTFDYSPELGEVLAAGKHTLSASFIPEDTEKYRATQSTAELRVEGSRATAPRPMTPMTPMAPASSEPPAPVGKSLGAQPALEVSHAVDYHPEPTNWSYTLHPARLTQIPPESEVAVEQEEKRASKMWLVRITAGFCSIMFLIVLAVPLLHRGSNFFAKPATQPPPATDVAVQLKPRRVAHGARSLHIALQPAQPDAPTPTSEQAEMMADQLQAPTRIARGTQQQTPASPAPVGSIATAGLGGNGAIGPVFNGQAPNIVMAAPPSRMVISTPAAMSLLTHQTLPVYPVIAKDARVSGNVVIEAVISKSGMIESLHAVSGPAMLRPAALEAVRTWRFKPYIVNNQPIEVQTTISVAFTLAD